jgi:biotin carboxyl carrier protein
MYKVKANNGSSFEVKNTQKRVFINNEEIDADIAAHADGSFHVLYKNRSYSITPQSIDHETKTCILKISGKKVTFELKDAYDELLEKMGMGAGAGKKLNEMKAPMPGLVLRLLVKEGDTVKKGDGLLVLEAMKMENILKSTGEGTVKKWHVTEKDKVEKGQLLISF